MNTTVQDKASVLVGTTTITERPQNVTGEVLRSMRHEVGISLGALADRAGCSHQHLALVESGECALTPATGHSLSRAIAAHILETRAA